MTNVFISYRRSDTTPGYASWIYEQFAAAPDHNQVVMDVDLQPAVDFVERLQHVLAATDVVLVLIGPGWLSATDENGTRRLDDPHDCIRLEVASALRAGVRVIPVLVDGTEIPPTDALPEELEPLTRRQPVIFDRYGRAAIAGLAAAIGQASSEPGRPPVTSTPESAEGSRSSGSYPAPLGETAASPRERKVVTALFCDLVGSTATGEQLDPEDLHALLSIYHASARVELERFGGTVEKFIGDAVVAIFGVPSVHEDDPERAVRAGLRVVETIGELNDERGLDLKVRVGIETAEALVALDDRAERGEGMVAGDGMNTASRLQSVAPVNGVVVGPGTYAATKDVFDYEALEPAVLKGKAEPVPLWQARSPRALLGTDITRPLQTPLVGRQIELGILTGCFQRAVRERTVQLVTIVGEPGVGKSRLVSELSKLVDVWPDRIRLRQGRCLPYGEGVSCWALGMIIKAEAGVLENDSPEAAGHKLEEIVPRDHPDATWLRARLRPLLGLDAPQAAREENFAAWRAFIELSAEDWPSVLVFEDLHWADDALLAFLEHLADYAEGVPLLLVGTARPELYERDPAWAASARNATRINLSPLSEGETASLISNLLAQAVLPAEVQGAILERSGGNPLYAEEFVRLLKDRGLVLRGSNTLKLDGGVEIPMPSGIQGLIAARLDTLSRDRKRLLQDAAVIGKVFWSEAVAQMGGREAEEVTHALHQLSRKELVRPARRSSLAGRAEYTFHHALVRDVCYRQIPRANRAECHRRAAAWIEHMSGGRIEDHAAILASHIVAALELAGNGADAQELRTQAIHYLTLAGDRSLAIDVGVAERQFAQALRLAPENAPERPGILARHAEALLQRGRFAEAAEAFEQAIIRSSEHGEMSVMATAMVRLSIVLSRLADPRERSIVDQAVRVLEPLGPSRELVAVLAGAATTYMVWDEPEGAAQLADRAISLASELGLPEQPRALGFRGMARACLGDESGVADMRQAIDVAISEGLGREAAIVTRNLAGVLWQREGSKVALGVLEEGLSLAHGRGIEGLVLVASADIVAALVELGLYDEALERAKELEPRVDATGGITDLLNVRSSVVAILTRRGQLDAALESNRWTTERARAYGNPRYLIPSLARAAVLHFAAGNAEIAHALLKELEPVKKSTGEYARVLTDAVRTALGLRDLELARRLAEGLPSEPSLWDAAGLTAGALIAEHESREAEAEQEFEEAAQRWQRLEVPWERAQALLAQGRCLVALGRADQAAEQFRNARTIFTSMDATPAIAQIDLLLARASATAP